MTSPAAAGLHLYFSISFFYTRNPLIKYSETNKCKKRTLIFGLIALLLCTLTIVPTLAQTTSSSVTSLPFHPVTSQIELSNLTKIQNNTSAVENRAATASAAGGFLGLPGFEALYAVAGLLAVAYLVMRRRK
jgi:PGF-CTERM protein